MAVTSSSACRPGMVIFQCVGYLTPVSGLVQKSEAPAARGVTSTMVWVPSGCKTFAQTCSLLRLVSRRLMLSPLDRLRPIQVHELSPVIRSSAGSGRHCVHQSTFCAGRLHPSTTCLC